MTAPKGQVRVKCESCGRSFYTKTARAKFCSATCRSRARRGAKKPEDPELVTAVRAELETAGKATSYAGQLAISLARQMGAEGATGITGLSRELRAAMAEALGPKAPAPATSEHTDKSGESTGDEPEDEVARARRERDEKLRQATG